MRIDFSPFKTSSRRTALLLCLQLLGYPLAPCLAQLISAPNAALSYPIRFTVFFLALVQLPSAARYWKTASQFFKYCLVAYAFFWFIFYGRVLYDLFVREVPNGANMSVYVFFPFLVSGIPTLALFQTIKSNQIPFCREYFTYAGVFCSSLFVVNIIRLSPEAKALKILEGRFGLEYLNPISAGNVGTVATIAATSFLIHEFTRLDPKRSRKVFGTLCVVLGLAMVFLAASRAPLVSLFAGVIVLLFAESRVKDQMIKRKKLTFALGVSLGVFVAAVFLGAQVFFGLNPFGRFETAFGDDPFNKNSGTHRLMIGEEALQHFLENPVIGSSAFVNSVEPYPHNMMLETLMAGGLLAAIPFIFLSCVAVVGWLRMFKSGSNPVLVALAFVFAIASSNSGAISENTEFWGIMAVLVAYATTTTNRATANTPVVSAA